jgi:bifunctional DNA-binding transcriptional regulator/antitoxin component of YhaV-PrlF toxin-antitoxin module
MASEVKRARISSKHQITIPTREFRRAGLSEGALVSIETVGPGQLLVTRIDDVLARHAGSLDTGGRARAALHELRDEWD